MFILSLSNRSELGMAPMNTKRQSVYILGG